MKTPEILCARRALLLGLTLPLAALLLTACSQQPQSAPAQTPAQLSSSEPAAPASSAADQAAPAAPDAQPAAPPAPKPAPARPKPKKVVHPPAADASPAPSVAATPAPPRTPMKVCTDCGVITAITPVKEEGKGTGLGAVAGGLAGLVIGNQIGAGNGKVIAKIAGAAGGALLGNKIEKKARAETHYEIKVRFDTGAETTVTQATEPKLAIGAAVRVVDGSVIAK